MVTEVEAVIPATYSARAGQALGSHAGRRWSAVGPSTRWSRETLPAARLDPRQRDELFAVLRGPQAHEATWGAVWDHVDSVMHMSLQADEVIRLHSTWQALTRQEGVSHSKSRADDAVAQYKQTYRRAHALHCVLSGLSYRDYTEGRPIPPNTLWDWVNAPHLTGLTYEQQDQMLKLQSETASRADWKDITQALVSTRRLAAAMGMSLDVPLSDAVEMAIRHRGRGEEPAASHATGPRRASDPNQQPGPSSRARAAAAPSAGPSAPGRPGPGAAGPGPAAAAPGPFHTRAPAVAVPLPVVAAAGATAWPGSYHPSHGAAVPEAAAVAGVAVPPGGAALGGQVDPSSSGWPVGGGGYATAAERATSQFVADMAASEWFAAQMTNDEWEAYTRGEPPVVSPPPHRPGGPSTTSSGWPAGGGGYATAAERATSQFVADMTASEWFAAQMTNDEWGAYTRGGPPVVSPPPHRPGGPSTPPWTASAAAAAVHPVPFPASPRERGQRDAVPTAGARGGAAPSGPGAGVRGR